DGLDPHEPRDTGVIRDDVRREAAILDHPMEARRRENVFPHEREGMIENLDGVERAPPEPRIHRGMRRLSEEFHVDSGDREIGLRAHVVRVRGVPGEDAKYVCTKPYLAI